MNRTAALASLAILAGAALGAPRAYVASTDGNIYRLDAGDQPEFVASIGQTPVSIGAQADHLIVADDAGRVLRVDPASGSVLATYQVWHGIAATAITAAPDDQIFVADATGNIAYLDADGHEVDTYYAGMEVSAMLVHDDNLVIGSPNTLILEAPFGDPNFQFISACGGIVNSLVLTDEHLFAGDANGTVYRFASSGGAYQGTFPTATDAKGVAYLGGDLLVAGSSGTLEHLDPITGDLLDTTDLGFPVAAIIVTDFPCPADLDINDALNLDDIDAFIVAYNANDAAADLDANGSVNLDDIDAFVNAFLTGCP